MPATEIARRSRDQVSASGTESSFLEVQVILTDPQFYSPSAQPLEICARGPGVRVHVANVVVRNAPEIPIITVTLGGGPNPQLQFTWNSIAGQSYQLESNASLRADSWNPVGQPLTGTGAELSISVPLSAQSADVYFRVIASPTQ